MIEIQGLSPKQMALADIMWSISDRDGVENFIATLPKSEAQTCRVLIELMQLAFLDEVTDTLDASRVIDKFRI
jgi:hypothetical protein